MIKNGDDKGQSLRRPCAVAAMIPRVVFTSGKAGDAMHERAESRKGPALGAPAPYFSKGKDDEGTSLHKFLGNWVILFSHPDELLSIFKTRTINYILCKRRIRAVAIGSGRTSDATARINFLEKYLVKHSLSLIEDADYRIARGYGLNDPEAESSGKGVFVIDPKGHLRMKLYFPQETERDFMDILKLVDALQAADKQSKQKNSMHTAKVLRQDGLARPMS